MALAASQEALGRRNLSAFLEAVGKKLHKQIRQPVTGPPYCHQLRELSDLSDSRTPAVAAHAETHPAET